MSTSTDSGGVVIDNSRVYSRAEIKAQGITLKVQPLVNKLFFYLAAPADEITAPVEFLEKNPQYRTTSDMKELVKTCTFSWDDYPSIYIKDLQGFKDIQLVSPPCDELTISLRYSSGFTLRDAAGVKMWDMLKVFEYLYKDYEGDHANFEGFPAFGGSNPKKGQTTLEVWIGS